MGGLGQEDPWLPPWGRQWSHQPGVCIPMPCVNQLWETNSIDRDAYPCCLSVLLVLLVLGAHLDQECLERKTQQMFKALVCVPWKNNMQIRGTWSLEGFISSGKEYITWKVGTWTGISLEEHNTCKSTRKLGQVLMQLWDSFKGRLGSSQPQISHVKLSGSQAEALLVTKSLTCVCSSTLRYWSSDLVYPKYWLLR